MGRMFIKPIWNVNNVTGEAVRTTLGVERIERRYTTGRGTAVTADTADEARRIWARSYYRTSDVQRVDANGVIVFMAAPRW